MIIEALRGTRTLLRVAREMNAVGPVIGEHFEMPLVTDPYRVNEQPPATRVDIYFLKGIYNNFAIF